MKKLLSLLSIFFIGFVLILANKPEYTNINHLNYEQTNDPKIFKKVLDNGLNIFVKPTNNTTNVAIQIWYNVGSKDEKTDEKGLAHLLEHTVFLGTEKMLSSSDISATTHKLSGYCNAMTSYDNTRYIFDLPQRHWQEALPILADCMRNCTLKQDLLNSEFKAVIQELKMGRDNYEGTLVQEMISTIFSDHPYHYPIVGFKQDIWKITSEKLYKFYKKHYIPNNATLIVVGNIDPVEAFSQAEKYFGHIKPDFSYKKKELYFNKDISAKSVTLYRDVQSPKVNLAFLVPGLKEKSSCALDVISGILASSASSRLYQKLQEEMQLTNDIDSFTLNLFDYDLFFIMFEPKNINDTEKIITIINDEIQNIIKNGITSKELKRVINCTKIAYYNLMTNNSSQANMIGKGFLATGNENLIFNYFNQDPLKIEKEVESLLSKYFRPSIMHKGYLLPISTDEKQNWLELQEKSDKEDMQALNQRIRTSDIEPCKYTNTINPKSIQSYDFPKPQIANTKNGMKILYHNNTTAPIISLTISLKADSDYDPEDLQGLYRFMTNVLIKGTKSHSFREIAEELESMGTSLSIYPGSITMNMLSNELEKSLHILNEILTQPKFDDKEIEKIRDLMLADIKNFWDNPSNIANNIICKNIYKNHPYSKNSLGTQENIKKITKQDLINIYKKYITPKEAILVIVGDLSNYDIKSLIEKTLGEWDGPEVENINYPTVEPIKAQEINHQINRDQVILAFSGLSIDRKHNDFDKLLIFDQIISGSMASKLFELRERTGLFYTISGSLTKGASWQPGLVSISTIVSCDKLKEAENLISNFIDKVVDTITDEEVKQAKDSIISSFTYAYSTNNNIVSTFLFLDNYELPFDCYNSKRINDIQKITLEEIKTAVKKVLNTESLIKVRVGRIKN